MVDVVEQQAFGQLQADAAGVGAAAVQRGEQAGHEVDIAQMSRADVDRHRQLRNGGLVAPFALLLAGALEHPQDQRHDDASLFGHADEFVGQQQAAVRMLSTHQRLDAHQPAEQSGLGLVMDDELA